MAEERDAKNLDEKSLKERFFRDLEVARKFTEPLHQQMDKNYEMYRNRWSGDKIDFQISDLYAYVETIVPILTNNRVRGTVKAEFPEYTKHAEGMTYILDHTFDVNNWDYVAARIARMAEIYRSALAYTGYDPDADNGAGKLIVTEVNPRWCYFDPSVTNLEDSSFFFYAEPMRATKVKKLYPEKAKEIDACLNKDNTAYDNDTGRIGRWFKSWVRNIANAFAIRSDENKMNWYQDIVTLPELSEEEKRKNAVAFIHYWYRDDEDKWRVSYWADDVLLEDMENPFWHGKLPYDMYSPVEDILSALGIPIAEQIEHLNYEKNVLMAMIVESSRKAADPPLLYNISYGNIKDPQALREKARDTGVVPVNNPDMVPLNALAEYMLPPQLPAWVDRLPERYDQMADRVSGVNDSFRGLSEASSGKEVQLKQEAAYTRIKTKVDNFEKFVKSISEKIIVNAMQFIDTTRPFRVKGDYRRFEGMLDEKDDPFTVQPIPIGVGEDGQPLYDHTEFFLYANPHEWTKIVEDDAGMLDEEAQAQEQGQQEGEAKTEAEVQKAFRILQFVVEIEAGSSLPTSRSARREEALELFSAGAIDQQALLEAFEYPNAEEIIRRMKEEQQLQIEQMVQEQLMKHGLSTQNPQMQGTTAVATQPQAQQFPDLASRLDQLRQIAPEIQNMSDEQLIQLLANMGQG